MPYSMYSGINTVGVMPWQKENMRTMIRGFKYQHMLIYC